MCGGHAGSQKCAEQRRQNSAHFSEVSRPPNSRHAAVHIIVTRMPPSLTPHLLDPRVGRSLGDPWSTNLRAAMTRLCTNRHV